MTKKILWVVAGLVILILAVTQILRLWQSRMDDNPRAITLLPAISPRAQIEFESGELASRLKQEQGDRLEARADHGGDFVQVPIETAIDWIVKHPRENEAKP